jgi:ubiquinol-cytochrome c reductase subunit 7
VCAGLRYDDLYDPYHDLDIKEALARLPREVVDARNQRLKRAMDLSMKHQYLPADAQVEQDFAIILGSFGSVPHSVCMYV